MAAEETLHLEQFTAEAKAAIAGAQTLADEQRHSVVDPLHLLIVLVERDRTTADALRRAGVDAAALLADAQRELGKLPRAARGVSYLSGAMMNLLGRAEKEAKGKPASIAELLNGLTQEVRGPAASLLQTHNLLPGSLRAHVAAAREAGGEGGAEPASLASMTLDWTAAARSDTADPVIGRDAEVRRVVQVLERRFKQHPLLVGEAGVGKSAVVRALARRIADGDVPPALKNARVLEIDAGAAAAGIKVRGEMEERYKRIFAALRASTERSDAVVFLPALDALLGNQSTMGDVLKTVLQRGDVHIVATTTPEGRKRIEERDPSLLRRLSVIDVRAPSADEAVEVVRGLAFKYESHHGVRIGDPAIEAAVRLAKRYLQDRALPESAIDLLDEAAARRRVENTGLPATLDRQAQRLTSLRAQLRSLSNDTDDKSRATHARLAKELGELEPSVRDARAELDAARARGDGATAMEVVEEDVAIVLGEWTGIPVSRMLESEAEKLLKMEDRLAERVLGQDEAVRAVARAVRRGRVGLRDAGKPIGSFLFLGPSGVGKTELAKALAEFLFDDETAMTRLDMSEFMEKHMAQRLVGAPPGYADSEEGGFLTEAVRRRPYSVLLFDEVEKAHADVFNLLLQVLDDGRLTDGRGRTADFSNTVVVMTSNIGSERILSADAALFESKEGRDALRDVLRDELRGFLRPEFLNRIDEVVVFRALSKDDLSGILDIQLRRVSRMLRERGLSLELTDGARKRLVDIGYEPAFGARPLRRAIARYVQDALSEPLLRGTLKPGHTVLCDVDGDDVVVRPKQGRP
jgi:ATP-dependent Clp protease ATP-binding subunit ClpB